LVINVVIFLILSSNIRQF